MSATFQSQSCSQFIYIRDAGRGSYSAALDQYFPSLFSASPVHTKVVPASGRLPF